MDLSTNPSDIRAALGIDEDFNVIVVNDILDRILDDADVDDVDNEEDDNDHKAQHDSSDDESVMIIGQQGAAPSPRTQVAIQNALNDIDSDDEVKFV